MKQISIAARIPPDWYKDIQQLGEATGQTQSEIVKAALAIYLKRQPAKKVASRLDTVEASLREVTDSLGNLRAIVLATAS
jgi:predicted transcriptional regulator